MSWERILLAFLAGGVILILSAWVAYLVLARRVGDCAVQWADGYLQVEGPVLSDESRGKVEFSMPIKSAGKQQCIVLDMIGRIHPEGDRYLQMDSRAYVYPSGGRRRDGYWEATLIKPGDTMILKGEIEMETPGRPLKEMLESLGYVKLDILFKTYCRNLMKYERKILTLRLTPGGEPMPRSNGKMTADDGREVLPIRTPLLMPGDDIYTVFDRYARRHIRQGDILVICESALAIMENRAYYVEEIRPGFLATHLNKLFKMDSSLSSPYSLQKGIEEVGAARIVAAVILGALGRLVGRAGDFYAFAGRAVATIDDCTGTLPPFDKYVVMGPADPRRTAREFREKTGFDLAVVDANDLGKVDVLGISCPEGKGRVEEALRTNPQGNDNQQTPIAIIRGGVGGANAAGEA